ncbi:MAG TPA: tetratricopeptide repeat protein [Gemmataceae bacterium]|nr:tetratricopeptide repeat protein [Gemmataceae bacterium]
MSQTGRLASLVLCVGVVVGPTWADQQRLDKSVEQIAAAAQKSVVVIRFLGRDGKPRGLGTGFVVAADGLIATNLHVLDEARPIQVELADGKRYDVTAVHASDRALDLAIIRIPAKGLTPLPLGDSARLRDGQAVVAIGNPEGLAHSVVSGVVSGQRAIDGRRMIQLAIPVEPGNSGGPLLDRQGRVQGILTAKSAVTANLGFAMPINALKTLLQKPNPIPMSRWLTIGVVDAHDWKPLFGAHWRQRAGHILVEGVGSGFGGRALCLWQHPTPAELYEVAVSVKLDDEAGAAGLVFHADGSSRHYGFYPTGGRLRLTRFEGPDVFTWTILEQKASPYYHPGEWNALKVHVGKGEALCYVNDHLVFTTKDNVLTGGAVGLAKFRDTKAEFKRFQVGTHLPPAAVPAATAQRILKAVEGLSGQGTPKPELVQSLSRDELASVEVLRQHARDLEQQARQLKKLATEVHARHVTAQLAQLFKQKDEQVDLLQAALLVARLDNEDLDIDAYRKEVERLAREVRAGLAPLADDKAKLAALNRYLFEEHGFHGSRSDYYSRSNSYLNEVIDDREGIPITLSVLYIELARRLGLRVVGVGLPGHFVVRFMPAKGEAELIDVFEGGKTLSRAALENRVLAYTGEAVKKEQLAAASTRSIIVRMLHNLLSIARNERDTAGMLRYVDAVLAVDPEAAPEHWLRAMLLYQAGRRADALADVDWVLSHRPAGLNLGRVRELRRLLTEEGQN